MKKPARLPGAFTRLLSFIPFINFIAIINLGRVGKRAITQVLGVMYIIAFIEFSQPEVMIVLYLVCILHYFLAYRWIKSKLNKSESLKTFQDQIEEQQLENILPGETFEKRSMLSKISKFAKLSKSNSNKKMVQPDDRTSTGQNEPLPNKVPNLNIQKDTQNKPTHFAGDSRKLYKRTARSEPEPIFSSAITKTDFQVTSKETLKGPKLDFDRIRVLRDELNSMRSALDQAEVELAREESLFNSSDGEIERNFKSPVPVQENPVLFIDEALQQSPAGVPDKVIEKQDKLKTFINSAEIDHGPLRILAPKESSQPSAQTLNQAIFNEQRALGSETRKTHEMEWKEQLRTEDPKNRWFKAQTSPKQSSPRYSEQESEQKLKAEALLRAAAFDDDPVMLFPKELNQDSIQKEMGEVEIESSLAKMESFIGNSDPSKLREKTFLEPADSFIEIPQNHRHEPSKPRPLEMPNSFEPAIVNGRYRLQPVHNPPLRGFEESKEKLLQQNSGDDRLAANRFEAKSTQAKDAVERLFIAPSYHPDPPREDLPESPKPMLKPGVDPFGLDRMHQKSEEIQRHSKPTTGYGRNFESANHGQSRYENEGESAHQVYQPRPSLKLDPAAINLLRTESEAVRDALRVEEGKALEPLTDLQDMTRVCRSLSPQAGELLLNLYQSNWRVPFNNGRDQLVNEINRQAEYWAARSIIIVNRGWIELDEEFWDEFQEIFSKQGNDQSIKPMDQDQAEAKAKSALFDLDLLSGSLRSLAEKLTDTEQETIRIIMRSNDPVGDLELYAEESLSMPELLIDAVNEKAMDVMEDILIDASGVPVILEEYSEDLRNSMYRSNQ